MEKLLTEIEALSPSRELWQRKTGVPFDLSGEFFCTAAELQALVADYRRLKDLELQERDGCPH